jgi:hypothetical protein
MQAPRGERSFSLVHDPILKHEVTRFSYDEKVTRRS